MIKDERIINEKRLIESRAYKGIIYVLLLSIIIQQFFLKAPFSQFAVEFFILIGCGIYNIVCNYKKGINIINPSQLSAKKRIINSIISAIVAVLLFAFLSGEWKAEYLLSFFSIFLLITISFNFIMNCAIKSRQRALEQELDEDLS